MEIIKIDNGTLLLKNLKIDVEIIHSEKGKIGYGIIQGESVIIDTLNYSMYAYNNRDDGLFYQPKFEEIKAELSHKYRIKMKYIYLRTNIYQKYVHDDKYHNIFYMYHVQIILNDKYYYRWLERMREMKINDILN